ncbi:hypothetical protein ABTE24_20870, partial [Acinetobacter baumannii]
MDLAVKASDLRLHVRKVPGQICEQFPERGRKVVGAVGQHDWQGGLEAADTWPHRDAELQTEGSHLVDQP